MIKPAARAVGGGTVDGVADGRSAGNAVADNGAVNRGVAMRLAVRLASKAGKYLVVLTYQDLLAWYAQRLFQSFSIMNNAKAIIKSYFTYSAVIISIVYILDKFCCFSK